MQLDFLVEQKKSIIIRNLTDGNITICKAAPSLKRFLVDTVYSEPITSVIRKRNQEVRGNKYDELTEYRTWNTSVSFTSECINTNKDIINALNSKRLSDMFNMTRRYVLEENLDISLIALPYCEQESTYKVDKDKSTFVYQTTKSRNNSIIPEELVNIKKLIDLFIKENGISANDISLESLGIIISNSGKKLITKGEPLEMILDRKVKKYEYGRIS